MNFPTTTILTTLAGVGAGALSAYLAQHQKTRLNGTENGQHDDGFDFNAILEAATKSGSAYLGGKALNRYMGIGTALGEKLAAAYLAGKAAKASAGEVAGNVYDETSHRAGDAFRVLRGKPTRYANHEEEDGGVSAVLVAAGVVGFGAALAAVLHKSWALDGDRLKRSAETAQRWAGLEPIGDDELTERIRLKIADRDGVGFEVHDGIVTVRGDVPDFQRENLLDEIRSVEGVKGIDDHLSRG
ncbi:MAG: BON domain-containing protein [Planctomycetota bacterium]